MCHSAFATAVSVLEQVAVRAARRIRKVIFAIGVEGETSGARRVRRVPVTTVAVRALLMLRFCVQAGERGEGVAARARGRRGDAAWSVRAMAVRATGGQF